MIKSREFSIFRSGRPVRGAACVLIVVMLIAFIISAAITVDFAYMQLIRTELRTATDAAAKAGAEALVRTQNADSAVQAAVDYASYNRVGKGAFKITTSDVTVGRVINHANGVWQFEANVTPYNAVRVNSRVGQGGVTSAMPTFFGAVLGRSSFSTSQQATAARQEVEVCLCLDRSGSMAYDMTGVEPSYASGNPLLYPASNYPSTSARNQCSPPHPTASRWASLRNAISVFLSEASQMAAPPRTSLVTWSQQTTLSYYPNTSCQTVSTDVPLPNYASFSWTTNRSAIETSINTLSSNPVAGRTNLSAGLDQAVSVLSGPASRQLSAKVVILLTDGVWNEGRDPGLAAADAAKAGITVHTISMLTSTQDVLSKVAATTGGKYYATKDTAQLQAAFRDIARSLPVVLTD